jgi:hypothetical protein
MLRNLRGLLILAAFSAAAAAAPVNAAWSPAQVVDRDGGFVTALQVHERGGALLGYSTRSSRPFLRLADGGVFGAPIRAHTYDVYAIAPGGEVLDAWIGGTRRAPLVAVQTLVDGRRVGAVQVLHAPRQQGYIGEVAIAAGPAGRAAIIWTSGSRDVVSDRRLLAAIRTAHARRFGAVQALTGTAPLIERLKLVYDGAAPVAAWEQRLRPNTGADRIADARGSPSGARFGAARTLVPRHSIGHLLGLLATSAGAVAVWQQTQLFVQLLAPGARRDTLAVPDPLGDEQVDASGSALIAVWRVAGTEVPGSRACQQDDIEAAVWSPAGGFASPRDLGPAGGEIDEPGVRGLTVALAPSGQAVIGVSVAPDQVADIVGGCVPSGDVVRGMTLEDPGGPPTPLVTLSPANPPPAVCRSCIESDGWLVDAAATDGARRLAWSGGTQTATSSFSP